MLAFQKAVLFCQTRKTPKHLNSNISYTCCKKSAESTLSKAS